MAYRLDAHPALKKVSRELEKLEQSLRRYDVGPSTCADLVQRTRERLSVPLRVHRPRLERLTLDKAFAEGRKFITPDERADLEDDPDREYDLALLNDASTRDLSPRCREVVRLYRAEQRTPTQIARRLKIKVDTVKRDLADAMKGFAHVKRRAKSKGVVE
jgi:RNA polymerase sigma factor (sigma-70 family)